MFKNLTVLFVGIIEAKMKHHHLMLYISYIRRLCNSAPLLIAIVITLTGCKTIDNQPTVYSNLQQQIHNLEKKLAETIARENVLTTREIAISKREKELVDLYAELVKERQALAESKANQIATEKSNIANHKNKIQQTIPKKKTTQPPKNNRIILGEVENVYLDPPGKLFKARIDTGAQTSSLNAVDKVEFERDGKPFVKFHIADPNSGELIELTRRIRGYVSIKQHKKKSQRRPVVRLRVKLGEIDEQTDFTLVDRTKFRNQVLIGRNLLKDLAIVDVSKKFVAPSTDSNDSKTK
ncbi:MAG: ATP-dependent zinc protease [Nitrosomonas sp.]|nr:ATP-dependent zinc protease [Nitrosomonas sp.]